MIFSNAKASSWKNRLKAVFSSTTLGPADLQNLEELLFEADFLFDHIQDIIAEVKTEKSGANPLEKLEHVLLGYFSDVESEALNINVPEAIAVVGVNGAGKTTFCARLAYFFMQRSMNVVLGAADTFRAGAVDQLKLWGERMNVPVVEHGMNSDSAAVAFDAWKKAKEDNAILVLDTAGRMHTKLPLMEQLEKMFRVLAKDGQGAPQHTWLVLDGSIGQNSLLQTQEFMKSSPLTGLVVTKLDGSSKGGAALSASKKLSIPLYFVGTGETEKDLHRFDLKAYVKAMLYNA